MLNNSAAYRIVIGGDFLPSQNNIALFNEGNAKELYSDKLLGLFQQADFSIVNLEGALTDTQEKQEKVGPVLKAPVSTINGIKGLGISAVALANNHILDYGERGYIDTIGCLESAGIAHVGSGKNIDEIKTYLSLQLGDKKVCVYNVSETFFNTPGKQIPGANLYDEYIVCNELKELKKKHDYIIVIYHGGAEYFPYPTPMVRKRFHRMADSGADFITAQHTHCIGCQELYNNAYLLYGQGNFFFARQWTKKMTREGLIMEICFREGQTGVEINKYKIHVTDADVVRYSSNQDLSDFLERSDHIDDEEMITAEYEKVKSADIMVKYLSSFKGNYFGKNLMLRCFPRIYKNQIAKSYSKEQILLNQTVVNQDRRQEDLQQVWNYIFKKEFDH